jgi:hypothetical protein
MMMSAFGCGNATALVNDPAREDVMDAVQVGGRARGGRGSHCFSAGLARRVVVVVAAAAHDHSSPALRAPDARASGLVG